MTRLQALRLFGEMPPTKEMAWLIPWPPLPLSKRERALAADILLSLDREEMERDARAAEERERAELAAMPPLPTVTSFEYPAAPTWKTRSIIIFTHRAAGCFSVRFVGRRRETP